MLPRASFDVAKEYCSMPLDFEPGSRYSYSNTGYLLLGHIFSRVAGGESFERLLQRRVLDPLGLKRTRLDCDRGEEKAGLAKGYMSIAPRAKPEVAVGEVRARARARAHARASWNLRCYARCMHGF